MTPVAVVSNPSLVTLIDVIFLWRFWFSYYYFIAIAFVAKVKAWLIGAKQLQRLHFYSKLNLHQIKATPPPTPGNRKHSLPADYQSNLFCDVYFWVIFLIITTIAPNVAHLQTEQAKIKTSSAAQRKKTYVDICFCSVFCIFF